MASRRSISPALSRSSPRPAACIEAPASRRGTAVRGGFGRGRGGRAPACACARRPAIAARPHAVARARMPMCWSCPAASSTCRWRAPRRWTGSRQRPASRRSPRRYAPAPSCWPRPGWCTDDRVTTHWEDIAELRAQFPALDVVQEGVRWVDIGRVVTSAGISAGIDMSLHLVERLAGRALAERTARQMDFAWTQNTIRSHAPSA